MITLLLALQISLFPTSQFESRAGMPVGISADARRMIRVKKAEPASGVINWRDLQAEHAKKGKRK